MRILLYSTDYIQTEHLRSVIVNNVQDAEVMVCRTFDHLENTLRTVYSFSVVVLMVADKEELLELLTIQKMLEKAKIILTLPEESDYIIKLACKLYPRFLSRSGQDFMEIADVLNKMVCSINSSAAQ